MRVFFAVRPPESLRTGLWRALAPLREAAPGVRWVPPDGYHVTLRFLGDVAAPEVARLTEAAEALAPEPSFPAELTRTGAFPARGIPRVHWVGVRAGPLRHLRHLLEEALAKRGFPGSGDRFSPHLTIGRARRPARGTGPGRGRPHGWAPLRGACAEFAVDTVHLVRSELLPTGPRYDNIHAVKLSTCGRGAGSVSGTGGVVDESSRYSRKWPES